MYLLGAGNQCSFTLVVDIVLICWEKRKIFEPKTELQEGLLSDFQAGQGIYCTAGPLGYSLKHPDWVTGVRAEGAERDLACDMYTTLFICSVSFVYVYMHDLEYSHRLFVNL